MKQATAISVGLHVAVLAWATLSYSGHAVEAPPPEALPVEFISEKDFTQLTKGIKEAPKKEKPKALVEKKADEPKPVEQPKAKVAKKEVKAAVDKVEEPAPKIKPPEEKKEAKAEPKPQPKIDEIAEKLKAEADKKRMAEIAPKLPPRRPPRPRRHKPKFNADRIAALLDKRAPARTLATGTDVNTSPGLGVPSGLAARLSQSELDALRARLMALWNPPVGIKNPEDYVIRIHIRLGRDGRLTAPPQVVSSGHGPLFNSARDSAVRAVFRGQPFDMLKPEHYSMWKDIEVTFDPRDMFRG